MTSTTSRRARCRARAIDHFVEGRAVSHDGLEYETRAIARPAALDVAWVALTNGLMGRSPSPIELAEAAYRVEKLLGVEGGKQDQYAGRGFNHLRFAGEEDAALSSAWSPTRRS